MKAMILAGGMSTRLYPLTKQVPKPLVPIAGEPNSAHVLRYLKAHGIDEVAINVFYLAEKIVETFGDGSRYGVHLEYLHESVLMGSAGGVKQLEPYLRDGTFVVIGCDGLTDIDLGALVAFHSERGALATIGLVREEDVTQYGVVILDERGRITDFQEKPARGEERSHLVNTGIYVFEPAIFDRIPAGEFYDFGKQVFPGLQADGAPFYGLEMPGAYWCDIGTPGEYRAATADVLTGKIVPRGARATGVPASATVHPSASINGPVRVGERSTVGANVRIVGPAVVGDDVTVGDGAVLARAIVWDRASIGAGAELRDTIVGIDYAVAPGTVLDDRIVANEPEARPIEA